ncbi:hypothetical protein GQ457_16G004490 [Hibiscus cannabinus]
MVLKVFLEGKREIEREAERKKKKKKKKKKKEGKERAWKGNYGEENEKSWRVQKRGNREQQEEEPATAINEGIPPFGVCVFENGNLLLYILFYDLFFSFFPVF